MRTALLTLAALSTLAPLQEADACGSYVPEPRIHRLSTHYIPRTRTAHVRSFVVLGGASNDKRAWKQLAPHSYDGTRIAAGEQLHVPMTFTIVGANGTKVVHGRNQVFLASTFAFVEPASAIEVPSADDRAIVIEGAHGDAKWIDLDTLKEEGITLGTGYATNTTGPSTVVQRGAYELGRFPGYVLGLVEIDGERRLVIGDGPRTSSVAI